VKFTDGNWMMQKGVRPFYPGEAHKAWQDGDSLRLLATRPIRHRGDTLEGPTLNVRLSSPAEDVIRVRITHFEGGEPSRPTFPTIEGEPMVDIQVDEGLASITSGQLTARVDRKNWALEFLVDGKVVTKSPSRGLGLMQVDGAGKFLHEQLSLGVGENVYGLGERFTSFVKNGQSIDMWNEDGGTGSDQAYKNVPFYMTNRGYGVFVAHSGRVSFEVASEKVSRVQFSVAGDELEYFVIYGPTPQGIPRKSPAPTGRPAPPPPWPFWPLLPTPFPAHP